jgi:stage II sporulation protein GA (sporulation sigma-E factor processing peptidase)
MFNWCFNKHSQVDISSHLSRQSGDFMAVYADVVFIINFLMNGFILYIVSKLIKKKTKWYKIIISSFIMSLIYCLFMFVPMLRFLNVIFVSAAIILIGVQIAFNPKGIKEYASIIVTCYITAFSVGGLGFALYYLTPAANIIGDALQFTINNFSIKILLFSTCTFYILFKVFHAKLHRLLIKNQVFYNVTIYSDANDVKFNALLDTGNSLKDPLNEYPVIIAEFEVIKAFLPSKMKELFEKRKENDLTSLVSTAVDCEFSKRIRIIPFTSIGKQNGVLCGFRPDKVEINTGDDVFTLKNVIIAIYNFNLSEDGTYHGLLGTEAINY